MIRMRGKIGALVGVAVLVLILFVGISTVFALGQSDSSGGLTNPLGENCNDLSCPATKVINFLFTIAIPLCGIILLVGGFQIMTAAGDPEKVSTGKKTLLYAVIGFAIILISGSVAALIQSTFGGS